MAMETRSFASAGRSRGRGKSNFGSRDYRMEGRRGEGGSSRGGGGGDRYGGSGGSGGGKNHLVVYCWGATRDNYFILSLLLVIHIRNNHWLYIS